MALSSLISLLSPLSSLLSPSLLSPLSFYPWLGWLGWLGWLAGLAGLAGSGWARLAQAGKKLPEAGKKLFLGFLSQTAFFSCPQSFFPARAQFYFGLESFFSAQKVLFLPGGKFFFGPSFQAEKSVTQAEIKPSPFENGKGSETRSHDDLTQRRGASGSDS